jgi:hypothetical protein
VVVVVVVVVEVAVMGARERERERGGRFFNNRGSIFKMYKVCM